MKNTLLIFVALIAILSSACSTINEQIENSSMNNLESQTEPSDDAIREMFIESGLGEGDGNLEELRKLPKERVIAVVQSIKNNGIRKGDRNFGGERSDQLLRLKAAYYLATLDVDAKDNIDCLLKATKSKDISIRIEAIEHVASLAGDGRDELLPVLFEAAPSSDGHLGEVLTFFFVDEAQKSTKPFLAALSKQPKNVRNAVAKLISYSDSIIETGTSAETIAKIDAFKKDPELGPIAAELSSAIKPAKPTP